jgi:hypothetical protein
MHEFAQQLWVPTGLLTTRSAEGVVGLARQDLVEEPRGRVPAKRGRPDHGRERVGDNLAEEAGVLSQLPRPKAEDDHQAQPLDPRQEVSQPAQRRQVAPVHVVDGEQERPAGSDVRCQPVQAMKGCQRRARSRLCRQLGGLEERRRKRGGAGEQLSSLLLGHNRKERLEELPDDAVRERALELGAACAQHLHARLLAPPLRLRHQGRLADSRRPLDRKQPTTACGRVDQSLDCHQLGLTLEEVDPSRERLIWRLLADLLPSHLHRLSSLDQSTPGSHCPCGALVRGRPA